MGELRRMADFTTCCAWRATPSTRPRATQTCGHPKHEYKMETSPILYDRALWTRWLTWREANADRLREADAVIDADCAEVILSGRV